MYRVELVEITEYAGDIERLSSACESIFDISKEIARLTRDFDEILKDNSKWYIKIQYYNIDM